MEGADLARGGDPAEPVEFEGDGPHVVALDTGIKLSIVRQFRERGCRITLLPCTSSAEEVLAREPDLVFLANGPGDPAALDYVVDTVRELVGEQPGGRDLPRPPAALPRRRAGDLQAPLRPPRRQPPGQGPRDRQDRDHLAEPRLRGPPARRRRGTIEADEPVRWETDFGAAELSHLNLYDRTVEGLVLTRRARAAPSSTTPRPAPARTTPATSSTGSWSWPRAA